MTPHGHLVLVAASDSDEPASLDAARADALRAAFARGSGDGLLWLGGAEVGTVLPPGLAFWRRFAAGYVTKLCTHPGDEVLAPPEDAELSALAAAVPAMSGAEYVTPDVLRVLWVEIDLALHRQRHAAGTTVQDFVRTLSPAWNVVGRVHFNLAENRRDEDSPFAFLATYTEGLSSQGKARHKELGGALREFAGASNKAQLLALLLPVQRAAASCDWLSDMVDAGEIFHPMRWTVAEAVRFLGDVPALEQAGVIVRMPATWRSGRPARPRVTASLGAGEPAGFGQEALLDFHVELTLDGEPLSAAETTALLAGRSGLALIRGQWVELDSARLQRTLSRFQEAERLAATGGLGFGEAMRMLSGADLARADTGDSTDHDWSSIIAGPWLAAVLAGLRTPEGLARVEPGRDLHGTLRPYQEVGVRWLHLLSSLGLGACLADDMGLGKTIQVLSLLLVQQQKAGQNDGGGGLVRGAGSRGVRSPSLLVAPASLLANWASEIERFAPGLRAFIAHPSAMSMAELKVVSPERLGATDLVITSYGTLARLPWLVETRWKLAILDEAQAIKNPAAKQTRIAKRLVAEARIALTGTPIENRLADLWSIFDYLNPGLLGSAKQFGSYVKRLAAAPTASYAPLRDLVRPYILRRLKTDRSVISDLPDKTEIKAWCSLSRTQAALYQQSVDELAAQLNAKDGIQRRGVVLAFLMRLKQICNHPSQWLGDHAWHEAESGKWARLRELAEVIAAKQEKMLVFTQFREVTAPLASFLGEVFGRAGLVLHGGTAIKQRRQLVQQFQEDEAIPFFVLSLKAGGAGLNLTAASHVVHFDRWWNPAVENQATDRAFRIGQTRNVLVHKFICKGTIEDKIDALITSKQALTSELLEGGAELNLTEMGDAELLRLVALDLGGAMRE